MIPFLTVNLQRAGFWFFTQQPGGLQSQTHVLQKDILKTNRPLNFKNKDLHKKIIFQQNKIIMQKNKQLYLYDIWSAFVPDIAVH